MEASTRTSGLEGDTEPELGVNLSQETFAVAVKVNGDGPPAPTSMNREFSGTKESNVRVGGGQLYPWLHWFGLSPGLEIYYENHALNF